MPTHQDADVGERDAELAGDLGDGQERLLGHAELVDEPEDPALGVGVP